MTAEADAVSPGGEEALYIRGLLALWYLRFRLEQELDRSHRAGHPLVAVLLAPNAPPRTQISEPALAAAAAAVKASVRRSDLVGWFDDTTIFVLIFDGDDESASRASQRWKNQIWLKTMHLGGIKWESYVLANASRFKNADDVLAAARNTLPPLLRSSAHAATP